MAFADLTDLEDQLDFVLDEQAQRQATAKLQQASNMAKHYARPLGYQWPESRCPAIVKAIVLNVVERYMRNPDGYTQSRAGDETLAWQGSDGKGSFYFTDEEKEVLVGLGNPYANGVYSVDTFQFSQKTIPSDTWVPVAGMPTPTYFPLFAAEDAWWWGE